MSTAFAIEPSVVIHKPLAGKVALVTGASRGIGSAIATELAAQGATVAINFRSNMSGAEQIRDCIRQAGGESHVFSGDISSATAAQNMVKEVQHTFQRIDILVNNAGITRDKSIRKMTDEDWLEVISTNLNGTYFCTSAALPGMVERKFGRIVNIASFSGQAGNFGQANYAASKGGIIAFTKVLALELARYNITANVVSPGFTATDMLSVVPADIREQIRVKIPMQRFGAPEEIAQAVSFLVCHGDYVTGQQLNVNGGMYM